jgi:hypothetical protein
MIAATPDLGDDAQLANLRHHGNIDIALHSAFLECRECEAPHLNAERSLADLIVAIDAAPRTKAAFTSLAGTKEPLRRTSACLHHVVTVDSSSGRSRATGVGSGAFEELLILSVIPGSGGLERWTRIFAQGVKWSFCLTAGKIQPANQERP